MNSRSLSAKRPGAERAPKSANKSRADAATSSGAISKPGKGSKAKRNPSLSRLHQRIPAELRGVAQWVVSAPTGRPLNPNTGGNASSNNPATWATFELAVAACEAHGTGFLPALALTSDLGVTVIDLDNKAERPADAAMLELFDAMVRDFASYTERSRSGRGTHIVVRGSLERPIKSAHVEMYDRAHFMTFTGDTVGRAKPIRDRSELLADYAAVFARRAAPPTPNAARDRAALPDEVVLKRAAKRGGDTWALLHREGYDPSAGIGDGSQSDADFAYMATLWEVSGNRDQVLRLFADSPLYRDSTNRAKPKDAGYPARTLDKVIAHSLSKPRRSDADDIPAAVRLVRASDVELEPVDWLWDGYLARCKLHILAGAPGTGKTTVALALASTVTTGGQWPDGQRAQPANVVIWSGEDGIADTLAPRLAAAGADLSRVYFVSEVGEGDERRAFDPATDLAALHAACASLDGVGLVIVDSVVSAISGDGHKNNEVRRGLQPLVHLGESLGAAVLGISHFSKNSAGRATLDRVTGSLAFGALARVVLATARGVDDRCVLVRDKSNLGPRGGGFRYTIELTDLFFKGQSNCVSRIAWGDQLYGEPGDLLGKAETKLTQRERATDWLADVLTAGPVAAEEVKARAEAAGIAEATLRRASEALSVAKTRAAVRGGARGKGRYEWSLPTRDADARLKHRRPGA